MNQKNKRMFNQARHISFRPVCLEHHSSGHSVDFTYLCVHGPIYVGEPLVQNTPSQIRQNTEDNITISHDSTQSSD